MLKLRAGGGGGGRGGTSRTLRRNSIAHIEAECRRRRKGGGGGGTSLTLRRNSIAHVEAVSSLLPSEDSCNEILG